ncbi:MAG TPA: hemerythrin family protein [Terracidiphilus sp.]
MANFTWNHACTIGVRAMDDQHGILMDTLNDLRLALIQGSGPDKVSEGLNRLIEFTRMHFSSEESLLEQSGYPEMAEHRRAHQHLLHQIEETAHLTQVNDELHTRSLLLFLRDWYTGHVETLDNQYGAWLNEHGIS